MSNKPKSNTVQKQAINKMQKTLNLEQNPLYLEERRAFIDLFTVCDATCKIYIEQYKKLKKKNKDGSEIKNNLDMRTIPSAFRNFNIKFEDHELSVIFNADRTRGHKSCKKLRNGIVHEMNEGDLNEVHKRYSELMKYMNVFLARINQF